MAVSDDYLTYVLDQLRPVVPDVRARRMFGGIGLYSADLFFGVIDDDVLYLKVDDSTRGEYEARGMPAFRPYEGVTSMNYSQLPEEILEEWETLQQWAHRSLDVARAAKAKGAKKTAKPKSAKKTAKPKSAKNTGTTKRRRP
jgi:DNA transformation protein and related proteins